MIFGTKTLFALALLTRRAMALELYGNELVPDPSGPLYMCEGDCDSSAVCACDMICYQIETLADPLPPGCTGTPFYYAPRGSYYDYCGCPAGGCDPAACAVGESILPPSTDAEGDPHIKSWKGEWFDYHGECDLELVHVPSLDIDGTQLDIHARTKIRYGYSFIESAAIRIGNDILEVSSWGEYAINGVVNALDDLSSSLRGSDGVPRLGGYRLYKTEVSAIKNKFDIYLAPNSNITIGNMKDLVSVKITGSYYSMFSDVSGLWGNYHGERLGRDGIEIEDINALGQEWQVRDDEAMLFRTARAPQYPAQCILPNIDEKEARRLSEGITEEAANLACDHLKHDENQFHNCVYDVTATNDLDLADAGSM